jgi:hypothetical protein
VRHWADPKQALLMMKNDRPLVTLFDYLFQLKAAIFSI